MNKCLVTKLKGSSNNTELLKIGEMRIKFSKSPSTTSGKGFSLKFKETVTINILGEGYFTDSAYSENKGNTLVCNKDTLTKVYVSNHDMEISIPNKYALTSLYSNDKFGANSSKVMSAYLDLDSLKYSKGMDFLVVDGFHVTGNIDSLKELSSLMYLNLNNSEATGNSNALKNLVKLTYLSLNNTNFEGNIDAFKDLASIGVLSLNNTKLSGNIDSIKELSNLSSLNLINTNITGSIDSLSKAKKLIGFSLQNANSKYTGSINSFNDFTRLNSISIQYAKLTGDLALLPSTVTFMSLPYNSESVFTWTKRPTSAKVIAIEGAPPIVNIDKMLQDQAACQIGFDGSSPSYFKIISATGTRSSASDAAVQTLQSKGYTVSITPA